jgi:hypothetical protein
MEIAGAGDTVTVADADFVASATEVAVTVTATFADTVVGALYVADVAVPPVSVPQAAPVQDAPETVQVTPLLRVSLATAAVKAMVWA